MMFFEPIRSNPERVPCMGTPEDDLHKKRHFDICRAVNMTNLSVVLGEMVESGHLDKRMASHFKDQVGVTLALILTENNRIHGF